jgi:hypothetical protein
VNPSGPVPVDPQPFALGGDFHSGEPDRVFGHPGGILSLSANGAQLESGVVWAATFCRHYQRICDPEPGETEGALHSPQPGILRAYAAHDVSIRLWTSEDRTERTEDNKDEHVDRLGKLAKFNPPTVANGRVYIANSDNTLRVYGLLFPHQYLRPGELRSGEMWLDTLAPLRGE